MNEGKVFELLFSKAAESKDPRGVVSACLMDRDTILASAASADDGIRHAEDLLLEQVRNERIAIPESATLYCTLEPCNKRTKPGMTDCTTLILEAGVKQVVFGASDPDHSVTTKDRLEKAGVSLRQVSDSSIIERCVHLFNDSVTPEHRGDVKLK